MATKPTATPARKVRTLVEMRALATTEGVEQITDWDDPRLVTFWEGVHAAAEKSRYCATFDVIVRDIGGVPRPVKDYFTIERQVEVTINSEVKTIPVKVRVYGIVGDEASAIKSHMSTFGRAFKTDVRAAAERAAAELITKSIKVTDSEFRLAPRKPKVAAVDPIAAA